MLLKNDTGRGLPAALISFPCTEVFTHGCTPELLSRNFNLLGTANPALSIETLLLPWPLIKRYMGRIWYYLARWVNAFLHRKSYFSKDLFWPGHSLSPQSSPKTISAWGFTNNHWPKKGLSPIPDVFTYWSLQKLRQSLLAVKALSKCHLANENWWGKGSPGSLPSLWRRRWCGASSSTSSAAWMVPGFSSVTSSGYVALEGSTLVSGFQCRVPSPFWQDSLANESIKSSSR